MIKAEKKKQNRRSADLNFKQFECKLHETLELTVNQMCPNEIKCEIRENNEIGGAWSGITKRIDQKPIYFYGTENGSIIRLKMTDLTSKEGLICEKEEEDKIQPNMFTLKGYEFMHVGQEQNFVIKRLVIEDEQTVEKVDHNLQIQVLKLHSHNNACLQIGQFDNDYHMISTRSLGVYQLQIFDECWNRISVIENPYTAISFAKTGDSAVIYKDKRQLKSYVRFGKVDQKKKFKLFKKQISFLNQSVTSLFVYKDLLFVGFLQKSVHVYSIKRRKLINTFDVNMESFAKRIFYYSSTKTLVVISNFNEILLLDIITGELKAHYRLQTLFEQIGIEYNNRFLIHLFNFLTKDILLIGGSFPQLFFLDWKSGQVVKVYTDEALFVGSLVFNNFLYLTHEKKSQISILC